MVASIICCEKGTISTIMACPEHGEVAQLRSTIKELVDTFEVVLKCTDRDSWDEVVEKARAVIDKVNHERS